MWTFSIDRNSERIYAAHSCTSLKPFPLLSRFLRQSRFFFFPSPIELEVGKSKQSIKTSAVPILIEKRAPAWKLESLGQAFFETIERILT